MTGTDNYRTEMCDMTFTPANNLLIELRCRGVPIHGTEVAEAQFPERGVAAGLNCHVVFLPSVSRYYARSEADGGK
jgi:hypothetical protein